MKVGDLIRCGDEMGVILCLQSKPPGMFEGDFFQWVSVLWQDGDIEGISVEDVDEIINS